jgi:hypothetical protein
MRTFIVLAALLPAFASAAPLTRPAGALDVSLTLEANVSADRALAPVSLAPDVTYGVTSDFTLALVQSGAAVTGFRGGAGSGVCVSGAADGCPGVYRNVGLEGLYSLAAGTLAAAASLGLHLQPVSDPLTFKVKVGAKTRAQLGAVAIGFNPCVFLALSERDGATDSLWLPVSLSMKPLPRLTTGLGTGVKVPDLSAAGDGWQVALGAFAQVQVQEPLALGASFVLGNVVGGEATADGLESRFAQVWMTYGF